MSDHEPIPEPYFRLVEYVQALMAIALLPADQVAERAQAIAMRALNWNVVPEEWGRDRNQK